ncbi:hypothetical protein N7462_009332 [Penicillium macrosclerotiorum]|uniref:uncharacterized protein n=1 Tax=Penicillium macrosclerotiorum TaxID=303699 RepID=UPI002547BEE9|nr:uncharacterized protein N7462_009332 [Penicillium macrosclerotiorum]KAJ5673893.1 hypothetical protein N7462_009332 [Penicillium macrosclerotiorum]
MPSWFPGAGFIKTAQGYKTKAREFSDIPFAFVKQQMKNEKFVPSFLSNILQENPVRPGSEEENIIKCFFLAMAFFPEAQRKAQQELETVIGTGKLPEFKDRENLPYINALVKEVLRWHPVVPMNVAHASIEDDMCNGYFIPKGSAILSNLWAFTHDPSVYNDPMSFKPERFLDIPDGHVPERDPHLLVFGFGRRACPGRTLADSNIFLTVSRVLAVFNITKPIENGKVQDVNLNFLPGVISHPAPFKLSINPRSAAHVDLIKSVEQKYPWEESHSQALSGLQY